MYNRFLHESRLKAFESEKKMTPKNQNQLSKQKEEIREKVRGRISTWKARNLSVDLY